MFAGGRWPSPLTRAFLARFFETEIHVGSHDVKAMFIWIISGLAAPGFVLPVLLVGWDWSVIGLAHGFEVLRQITRADKIVYVGLGMVATGLLSALVWNSVLVDRRDALILGALPVRPSAIVRAKLQSVTIYVVVVAAGMHVLASLTFGQLLSVRSWRSAAVGTAAHFAASTLASLFVLFSITGAQALLAIVAGPRRLGRASAWLQAAMVAAMLMLFVSLGSMSRDASRAFGGARAEFNSRARQMRIYPAASVPPSDAALPGWLEWAPPLWFFGVYETVLGTDNPHFQRLARTGLTAVGLVVLITFVGLPLAYRRVMIAGVETASEDRPGRLGTKLAGLFTRAHPTAEERGIAQFLLATMGRVPRQRFVLAAALGANLAWALPVVVRSMTIGYGQSARPPVEVSALVFSVLLSLLVGVRLVAALPADLRGTWIFSMVPVPSGGARRALRRTMLGAAVTPVVGLVGPLYWWFWGPGVALETAALVVISGFLASEALLVQYAGMPCAHPWQAERPIVRRFWAVITAPLLFVSAAPAWALWFGTTLSVVAAIFMLLLTALFVVAARQPVAPEPALDVDGASFRILGLD